MQQTRGEVRNFIGGEWANADGRGTEPVYNPATGRTIAGTPLSTKEDVDHPAKTAGVAFAGWSATPVTKPVQVLFRFKMLLEEHFGELRDPVTLENGNHRGRHEKTGRAHRGFRRRHRHRVRLVGEKAVGPTGTAGRGRSRSCSPPTARAGATRP